MNINKIKNPRFQTALKLVYPFVKFQTKTQLPEYHCFNKCKHAVIRKINTKLFLVVSILTFQGEILINFNQNENNVNYNSLHKDLFFLNQLPFLSHISNDLL